MSNLHLIAILTISILCVQFFTSCASISTSGLEMVFYERMSTLFIDRHLVKKYSLLLIEQPVQNFIQTLRVFALQ
jgi:hypothetical protein